MCNRTIRIKIRINTRDAPFVGSIEVSDGIPDFSLNFEIMLKLIDDIIIGSYIGFIVIFIELRLNVFRGFGILVGQSWVCFIGDVDIFLEKFGVSLLFGRIQQSDRVVVA